MYFARSAQVNGWEMHYMEKSFLHQCKERFGVDTGEHVWEECNQAFDRLPLAAVIDHEIFCIHGGFPRPIHIEGDGDDGETQLLVSLCEQSVGLRLCDGRLPNSSFTHVFCTRTHLIWCCVHLQCLFKLFFLEISTLYVYVYMHIVLFAL